MRTPDGWLLAGWIPRTPEIELPPGPNTYPKGFVARLYRW